MVSTGRYQNVIRLLGSPLPSWVSEASDTMRVAAYDGYDAMYANIVDTFKVAARGDEDHPIYVPSARRIVEAVNRYLAKDWQWSVNSLAASVVRQQDQAAGDPGGNNPAEAKRLAVQQALANLFMREEMPTKFYSLKRTMVKKGDGVIHVTIDQSQPQGERISINELDPRNVFKITDPANVERVNGYYIVDLIMVGTTQIARRLEYRKIRTAQESSDYGTPIGQIYTRLTFWDPTGWDDRWDGHPALKPVPAPEPYASDPGYLPLLTGGAMPTSITALPVYHVRNGREGGEPWGTSQLSGLETLIAGVNGTVSDEDLTLALQGIGVYATNAKRPIDEKTGEEVDWYIAPGAVIELNGPNDKFERVNGVASVAPFQDHVKLLKGEMEESAGLSASAVGRVDANVAKSGIALKMEMAPILAQNEEKELELLARMDQLLHDLVFMWLPLEGVQADPKDISVTNSFGDPLPPDRDAIIKEVTDLVTAGLMSKQFAVDYLSAKLGYSFPSDMVDKIRSDEDRVAARMAQELGMDFGAGAGTTGAPSPTSGQTSPPSATPATGAPTA